MAGWIELSSARTVECGEIRSVWIQWKEGWAEGLLRQSATLRYLTALDTCLKRRGGEVLIACARDDESRRRANQVKPLGTTLAAIVLWLTTRVPKQLKRPPPQGAAGPPVPAPPLEALPLTVLGTSNPHQLVGRGVPAAPRPGGLETARPTLMFMGSPRRSARFRVAGSSEASGCWTSDCGAAVGDNQPSHRARPSHNSDRRRHRSCFGHRHAP